MQATVLCQLLPEPGLTEGGYESAPTTTAHLATVSKMLLPGVTVVVVAALGGLGALPWIHSP